MFEEEILEILADGEWLDLGAEGSDLATKLAYLLEYKPRKWVRFEITEALLGLEDTNKLELRKRIARSGKIIIWAARLTPPQSPS